MNYRDSAKLTKLWDGGKLKNCYILAFSGLFGFRIFWNNEEGLPQNLISGGQPLPKFWEVLRIFETEEQAKEFLKYRFEQISKILLEEAEQ